MSKVLNFLSSFLGISGGYKKYFLLNYRTLELREPVKMYMSSTVATIICIVGSFNYI